MGRAGIALSNCSERNDMAERRAEDLLLIAARAPVPGYTKTRLGETIGDARAAALYSAFLADLANRFTTSASFQVAWAFTPLEFDFPNLIRTMGPPAASPDIRFVGQFGESWGERQTNLLRWGHEQGYAHTILMASDSPQLPLATVLRAFQLLRTRDVTFGRVHDGGYYLIGTSGFHDVLSGVPMSTASAADALAARIDELGLSCAELPCTFDIDVEDDLNLLVTALAPYGVAAPHTWRALIELGLVHGMPRAYDVAATPVSQ